MAGNERMRSPALMVLTAKQVQLALCFDNQFPLPVFFSFLTPSHSFEVGLHPSSTKLEEPEPEHWSNKRRYVLVTNQALEMLF